MSEQKDDEFFPGFIEDQKLPKASQPPAVVHVSEGAFNPFDEPASVSVPVPDPSVDPAPSPAKPADGEEGFNPFAGSEDQGEGDDGELKPGSRKDLWNCPHCGTGNRPNRDTCRSCGKSPAETVIQPWFKNPLNLGVIGGAVVLLIIVVMMFSGPSFALGTAHLASIGDDLHSDESAGGSLSYGDDLLLVRGRFAAVGRVVASASAGGATTVTIVFGERPRSPDFKGVDRGDDEVGFTNGLGTVTRLDFARVTLLDEVGYIAAEPRNGQVIALTGQWGDLAKGASSDPATRKYVVSVSGYRSGE